MIFPVPIASSIAYSPASITKSLIMGDSTSSFTLIETICDSPSPQVLIVVTLYCPVSETSIVDVVSPVDHINSLSGDAVDINVVTSPLHKLTSLGDKISIS